MAHASVDQRQVLAKLVRFHGCPFHRDGRVGGTVGADMTPVLPSGPSGGTTATVQSLRMAV
ncbi:hypothetical protein [Pseudarthrobacter raffinosi]|uniref:hypothetical protein n=1 Tax=Pseudarthrobacter raffinosi TaxID=2953651 RepID=UPI00208E363B|nr:MULTISPECIES: hypothetical protein [unclassified Pseudarthrobacter]MCO4239666.1 hypothetical protein [Pseudarthrobacter sp. MDT3-28]MCO4253432.1 hypothetical protein [Pseudarthrobacter sp. MDT3-9]MCO4265161.1 hypothetical protein [Pseudarthrobacter sp. MDT3-26]